MLNSEYLYTDPPHPQYWTDDCACRNVDWFNPWFGDDKRNRTKEMTEKHKAVCETCPSMRVCLSWAIKHEKWGMFGGTTGQEREKLRRLWNLPPVIMLSALDEFGFEYGQV